MVNIAGAFFGPSSAVYITKLIPTENRKIFNSMMSMTSSGAFLLGPAIAGLMSTKIQLRLYIGAGIFLSSLGYFGFYASYNLITATVAFILLGFFMAFASSGYATFYQNHVPVEIMGRFGSLTDMFQGIVQIALTLILGLAADWFSLQVVCLIASAIGVLLSIVLLVRTLAPSKLNYFREKIISSNK